MSSALLDPSGTRDSRIPEVDSETHELGVYVNVVMMDGSFGKVPVPNSLGFDCDAARFAHWLFWGWEKISPQHEV